MNGQDLGEIILVNSCLQCCPDLSLHGIPATSERSGPIYVHQVFTDLCHREGVEENFGRLEILAETIGQENGVSESTFGVFDAKIHCLHSLVGGRYLQFHIFQLCLFLAQSFVKWDDLFLVHLVSFFSLSKKIGHRMGHLKSK